MTIQDVLFVSRKYFIALGCALVLMFFDGVLGVQRLRWPAESIVHHVSPFQLQVAAQVLFLQSQLMQFVQTPVQVAQLEADKARLEAEMSSFEQQLATATHLCTVHERLHVNTPAPTFSQTAHVLAGGNRWGVDRGTADGVAEGDLVLAAGVLIGKVEQVFLHSAQITLLARGEWGVVVQNSAGTQGVIKMSPTNRLLQLDHITAGAQLKDGDRVYTSGVAGDVMIPRGLYVGSVTMLQAQHVDLSRQAVVDQGIQIAQISTVEIQRW